MQSLVSGIAFTAALTALAPPLPAAPQAAPAPQLYVVRDVRLVAEEDAPRVQLLLAHGRIEKVLEPDAPAPPGARVIEGKGALVLPAFIDAYTYTGHETPAPNPVQDKPVDTSSDVSVDMRLANRKGIQPAFRAAEVLALTEKSKAHRDSGFGALLSAPRGQLLSGTSVLATTRDVASRDAVIRTDVFAHAAFRATGDGYPSTLMGYTAQLRQFFLDVHRQAELVERDAAGRPGPRPPFDADLAAGLPLLMGEERLVCEAEGARDVERWLRLSRELGLTIAISGGREAYRHAGELAERSVPVFMTLDWGEEPEDPHAKDKKKDTKVEAPPIAKTAEGAAPSEAPAAQEEPVAAREAADKEQDKGKGGAKEGAKSDDDKQWQYEQPLGVREERRRLWEERRDGAVALNTAGVPFAFGSGAGSATDLIKHVRTLVEHGLAADVALAGLTSSAADLLGVGRRMGRIAPGFDATIALWTEHPLTSKDAQLAWLFIDGFPHEYEVKAKKEKKAGAGGPPAEGVDATGTWTFEVESERGTRTLTAELTMEPDGSVSGKITTRNPMDDSEVVMDCEGSLSGTELALSAEMTFGEFTREVQLKGEIEGDEFTGEYITQGRGGERSSTAKGTRKPR